MNWDIFHVLIEADFDSLLFICGIFPSSFALIFPIKIQCTYGTDSMSSSLGRRFHWICAESSMSKGCGYHWSLQGVRYDRVGGHYKYHCRCIRSPYVIVKYMLRSRGLEVGISTSGSLHRW